MSRRVAYVSAAFDDWKLARECQRFLVDHGYVIEDDWTQDAEKAGATAAEHKNELDHDLQRQIAVGHINACLSCDLHVLAFGHNAHKMGGGWIELGVVLGQIEVLSDGQRVHQNVHVIAPPRNSVFFHVDGVKVFYSFEIWRTELESYDA